MAKQKKDNVVRGKFNMGENYFRSSQEKTEQIMKEVEIIRRRAIERQEKNSKKR